MKDLHIPIEIDSELYTKNPDSSELGKKIISNSIELIYELGFEQFTFKKLGLKTNSPESSIYRYFNNKHRLLIYLTSWYWTWMEYKLVFATTNIESPSERLHITLDLLTKPVLIDNDFSYVNEILLSGIIFSESIKTYHTKNVDEANSKGSYTAYKTVVNRVAQIILEIKPSFPYPHMLISTVIEGAHHQKYFSEHLPELTDLAEDRNAITNFYKELVFNFL
ncbi:TetR/AcrR family transcriptional regulator [Flavicella sp.]|uniref:TetR/AcrR family transcriptional regulator n=1 Tax=Flavicella sp. TaxID=2957742 RepID=UPI0030172A95